MYLYRILHSLLPLRNPIGFGASDLIILAIALLLAFILLLKAWLSPRLHEIAGRTRPCMALLFMVSIGLRLLLFPVSPTPIPSGADDFGYLLLGDTLSHFRFANPTHPLSQFFESVFILQQPTYSSIYPPGQGIVLAFAQLLTGNPWIGVLLSSGVFCALCYWMLRAWVRPVWALTGGLLAIMEFGPLSPWLNSYWGGYVSAIAGCLVFGALPRLRNQSRMRDGLLLGAGLGLQIMSRPFEAAFLFIAVAIYFAFKTSKPPAGAALVATLAAAIMLLQNHAVTNNWTKLPYVLSRQQYGVPTTFTFQPNPIPHRQLTAQQDLDYKAQAAIHGSGTDTFSSYVQRLLERFRFLRFFLLPPLYLLLMFCLHLLRQRRSLWVLGTILLFALGSNFYPYFFPHYIAALACLFVLISVLGLEKLPANAATFMVALCATSFLFWFGIFASGNQDALSLAQYQSWNYLNVGDPQGRLAVQDQLAHSAGPQLVFVRYSTFHKFEEWVHNSADIDASKTVWANDLGRAENEKLLHYYPNRKPWLLEPDKHPTALTPYSRDAH